MHHQEQPQVVELCLYLFLGGIQVKLIINFNLCRMTNYNIRHHQGKSV